MRVEEYRPVTVLHVGDDLLTCRPAAPTQGASAPLRQRPTRSLPPRTPSVAAISDALGDCWC